MESRLARRAARKLEAASATARYQTIRRGDTEFTIVRRSGYPVQVAGERMHVPGWPLRDSVVTDGPVEIAMAVVSAALDRQQAALAKARGRG